MSWRRIPFAVIVLFVLVHASDARNFPSDQKTFAPCIPRKSTSGGQQAFDVHASAAPTAESPAGDGLNDEKNFIYGGVGGYAGIGGIVSGIPLLSGFGGIGSFGGIGGFVGVSGNGGGLGGSGGSGGLGGSGSGGGLGGSGGTGTGGFGGAASVLLPCP